MSEIQIGNGFLIKPLKIENYAILNFCGIIRFSV